MGLERRGCVVQPWPLANWKREEPVDKAKPFKNPEAGSLGGIQGREGQPGSGWRGWMDSRLRSSRLTCRATFLGDQR